jgi:hypothetical protein
MAAVSTHRRRSHRGAASSQRALGGGHSPATEIVEEHAGGDRCSAAGCPLVAGVPVRRVSALSACWHQRRNLCRVGERRSPENRVEAGGGGESVSSNHRVCSPEVHDGLQPKGKIDDDAFISASLLNIDGQVFTCAHSRKASAHSSAFIPTRPGRLACNAGACGIPLFGRVAVHVVGGFGQCALSHAHVHPRRFF